MENEKRMMELDVKEEGLLALAVRMQIDILEEGLEAVVYAPGFNKIEVMNMKGMLVLYKKLYKRFDLMKTVVDDFMQSTEN